MADPAPTPDRRSATRTTWGRRLGAAIAVAMLAAVALIASASAQPAPAWRPADPAPYAASSFVGGRQHAGEVLDCDLPGTEQFKNIGSYVNGAGMCVMSSIEMAARLQGMEEMRGLRDWCAKEPGGGYPSKVVRQIDAFCKKKGIPVPPYVQYEGPAPGPVIAAACRSGRMPCITYGTSPRYGGMPIAHMTCMPKYSGQFAVCLDNNFPGEDKYEWMSLAEADRRVTYPGKSGWVFVWLTAPPPPSPRN